MKHLELLLCCQKSKFWLLINSLQSKARVMPMVPSSLKRYDTIKISLADKMVCQVKVPSIKPDDLS